MVIRTKRFRRFQKVRRMRNQEMNNYIIALTRGDKAALERLYAEMSRPVYFYALRLCGDTAMAEDVMQDTFLAVWHYADTFAAQSTQNGRAWLFTIAKNKTLDRLRDRKRHTSMGDRDEWVDARQPVESMLSELAFWQRLSPLSEKERDVVSLRLLAGMTLTEVAEELTMPKGTVFWTYNQAIKKLRNAERDDGVDEETV